MATPFPALLVAIVLAAPGAHPAPAPSGEGRAVRLFEESARVYREGRFMEAIELLLEARAIAREPVLLYNLARAYEALGKLDEAADAYTRYLGEEPQAPDRGAIEGRIATLKRAIDERDARARAQPVAAPRAPSPVVARPVTTETPGAQPGARSPVPWVVGAAGLAGLAAGASFGILALARDHDARAEPVQTLARRDHDDAARYATVANVALSVGGVLTVVSGVWLVARTTSSGPSASASPSSPSRQLTLRVAPNGFVFAGTF